MALIGHIPGRFIENFHGTALELKFSHDLKWFSGMYSPALAHKPHMRSVVSTQGHVLVQVIAGSGKIVVVDSESRDREACMYIANATQY